MSNNRLNEIRIEIDATKEIMIENIEKQLKNNQNVKDLELKTDQLQLTSKTFQKSSKNMKYTLMWRHYRFKLMIFLIIAIVLTILLLMLKNNLKLL